MIASPSRARRLLDGWSANLVQMVLGITQQIALVPVFLYFWSSEILAGWLVIYAAGNLALLADVGLQSRAINRFLSFKSNVDCDGRTARFYAAMLRVYLGLAAALVVALLTGIALLPPSTALGFKAVPRFDAAFFVMTAGAVLALPSALVSGMYRARGLYGRTVRLQNWGMVAAQLGQLVAILATQSLLAVAVAYVAAQTLTTVWLIVIDAPRLFPFLRNARGAESWRWTIGQFRRAAPFAVANVTELTLVNLPVLLVSALVSDRVAVAQWGLTRIAAGLLRTLCVQASLPLAAELGEDYALGLKDRLRDLYARGSALIALLASVTVSALLPFWQDFFELWTHGAVPYDPLLTIVLLIGTSVVAPSLLALGYANYSNRGDLLARTKGFQLVVFLALSVLLIPVAGPLGAALAVVAGDLAIQFGLLGSIIIRQTLQRPLRHIAFLLMLMVVVTAGGWGLGMMIRSLVPGEGLLRFITECACWLAAFALLAAPLANATLRDRLAAAIPR